MTDRHLFCLGFGYSARAVADTLTRRGGWTVTGTHRKPEKASGSGDSVLFGRGLPTDEARTALETATDLLISIPPDGKGDPALELLWDAIAAAPRLRWIGYLSTTGVYGDRDGAWVDERDDLLPTGSRGRRRVRAEKMWEALGRRHGITVASFRLAGIYGPGRNALETVKQGRARRLVKEGQVFSRIHLNDIAATVVAGLDHQVAGPVNVCDMEAAPPQEVIRHACEMLGVAPPPEIPLAGAEISAMARSFYRDNKRVSNRRMIEELGVKLTYPTYREGLAALLHA